VSQNASQPPGPVEAGFRAAHKARKKRLGILPERGTQALGAMLADLRVRLEMAEKRDLKLERENSALKAKIEAPNLEFTTGRPPKVRWITQQRARQFGLMYDDVVGSCRCAVNVEARQAAIHDVRQLWPDLSYPTLGRLFGNRNHSTIIHSERQHQARLDAGTARPRPLAMPAKVPG